jgi:hypothetical protein
VVGSTLHECAATNARVDASITRLRCLNICTAIAVEGSIARGQKLQVKSLVRRISEAAMCGEVDLAGAQRKSGGELPGSIEVYFFQILLTYAPGQSRAPCAVMMASVSRPSPDQTLASDDPGDDTARRYKYQWSWAAIMCCALLDDTQDVAEMYCEHHEDVLIKHRDGKFSGQQIKSRESDQPVWRASDEQVRNAFAKFVRLDADYPGDFRRFHFLTNHPFHSPQNAESVRFVLSRISDAPTLGDLPSNVRRWLNREAQDAAASELVAFQALKKASASDDLPKLQDATVRLIETLTSCWSDANETSHESVRRAARSLIDECGRASSLEHQQSLPAYLIPVSEPTVEVTACIAGKRMTPDRVRAILTASLTSTALLTVAPEDCSEPGQGSTDLLLKKLDAGKFSAVSRTSAENLRDKADYLGIAWTKKLGRQRGLQRYEHFRSIALSDAASAFEATKTDADNFGPAMKEELRRLFHARRSRGEQLFDCTDEHLEGLAYSLTAQCMVQWSIQRPWEAS